MQVPSGLTAAADLVKLEKTLQFIESLVHGHLRQGIDFLHPQGQVVIQDQPHHAEEPLMILQPEGLLDIADIRGFIDRIQKQHPLTLLSRS